MDQYMKMTTTSFLHTAVQSIINRIMESKQSCEVGDTYPFRPDIPGFQVPFDSSFHRKIGFPLGRFPSVFILATALVFSVNLNLFL